MKHLPILIPWQTFMEFTLTFFTHIMNMNHILTKQNSNIFHWNQCLVPITSNHHLAPSAPVIRIWMSWPYLFTYIILALLKSISSENTSNKKTILLKTKYAYLIIIGITERRTALLTNIFFLPCISPHTLYSNNMMFYTQYCPKNKLVKEKGKSYMKKLSFTKSLQNTTLAWGKLWDDKKNSGVLTISSARIVHFVQNVYYFDLCKSQVSGQLFPQFPTLHTVTFEKNVFKAWAHGSQKSASLLGLTYSHWKTLSLPLSPLSFYVFFGLIGKNMHSSICPNAESPMFLASGYLTLPSGLNDWKIPNKVTETVKSDINHALSTLQRFQALQLHPL